ncbi:MAG: hypothetical protein ACD_2C00258G0015 [uncultured bacterium (gcode 4)]|uniref:Uncharacterized protein n=1 Tax=uncultured bacterium (gcode 4) TaxID=1234023 RepID=K2GZL9_9BACT|nr:MAG: hypothetical protein ACD_2C00258G0015 [uncultured bacterium (gcode 4)]
MKNKLIVLLTIIILFVIGFSIVKYNTLNQEKEIKKNVESTNVSPEKVVDKDAKDNAEEEIRINSKKPLTDADYMQIWKCDKIKSAAAKEICEKEGEKSSISTFTNIRQCDALKFLKSYCKDKFYYETAMVKLDIVYCSSIADSKLQITCKDNITYRNALNSWNQEACKNIISDLNLKKTCVSKTEILKTEITQVNKESEIFKTAISTNNYNLCSGLNELWKIVDCISPIVTKNKDISICSKVFTTKENQDRCFNLLSIDYDRMIIREAFTTKNLSLCDKLYNKTTITQCKAMKF